MRTLLYSACYLNGKDDQLNSRFKRTVRYLDWYLKLKSYLHFEHIVLADNKSCLKRTSWLMRKYSLDLSMIMYPERLTKQKKAHSYPYVWRAFYELPNLLKIYDRVIMIDTDCFVLSKRLAEFISKIDSGWEAFFIPKYHFPSTELMVICRDQLPAVEKFCSVPYMSHDGKRMEDVLPFSWVHKNFTGDRYGETRPVPQQDSSMDFYAQSAVSTPFEFRLD